LVNDLKIVAFIPARSGSKRIKDKNIIDFFGHPLCAYTIKVAQRSEIFDEIFFITDSPEYEEIARCYGIEKVRSQNSDEKGLHSELDNYIRDTIIEEHEKGNSFDCFSILRPTNPFRQSSTIKRAWAEFQNNQPIDSLRAVELCKQHPGKMYKKKGNLLYRIWEWDDKNQIPYNDMPYQALPEIWVQNGSLEIAWAATPMNYQSFSGKRIYAFETPRAEAFDINNPEDLEFAKYLVEINMLELPEMDDVKKRSRRKNKDE